MGACASKDNQDQNLSGAIVLPRREAASRSDKSMPLSFSSLYQGHIETERGKEIWTQSRWCT